MDLQCPYCQTEQEVCHDDGHGYEENEKHQMQCSNCDKHFVFETTISFYYEAEKANCLNDGKHKYQPTHTSPNAFTCMECSSCGEKRDLTDSERTSLKIPTRKEYYNEMARVHHNSIPF